MREKGFIEHWKGNYLSSNTVWTDTGLPIGRRFTYLTTSRGARARNILVFGFLYDFENACAAATVEKVEEVIEQEWFIDALTVNNNRKNAKRRKSNPAVSLTAAFSELTSPSSASKEETSSLNETTSESSSSTVSSTLSRGDSVLYQNYDAVLVMAHMGYDHPLIQVIQSAIRNITGDPTLPIQFIAGDSHVRGVATLDERSSVMQAGRFLDTIGFVSFPLRQRWQKDGNRSEEEGTNANEMISETLPKKGKVLEAPDFQHVFLDANKKALQDALAGNQTALDTGRGRALTHFIQGTRLSMGLTNHIGCSGARYRLDLPVDHPRSLWGLYLKEVIPHALGNNHSRVFIQSTMALRYDMLVGPITVDDAIAVSPVPDEMVRVLGEIDKTNLRLLFSTLNVTAVNSKRPHLPKYAISPWPHSLYHLNSKDNSNHAHSLSTNYPHSYELYAMKSDWPAIQQALVDMAADESNTFSTWDFKPDPELYFTRAEPTHPQTSFGVWIDFVKDNWMCVAPKTKLMIFTGKDLLIWLVVLTALAGLVHYHSWINHRTCRSSNSYMRMGGVTVPRQNPKQQQSQRYQGRGKQVNYYPQTSSSTPNNTAGKPPPYGAVNFGNPSRPNETTPFLMGRPLPPQPSPVYQLQQQPPPPQHPGSLTYGYNQATPE